MGKVVYVNWEKYKGRKLGKVFVKDIQYVRTGTRSSAYGVLKCECGRTITKRFKSKKVVEAMRYCGSDCKLYPCRKRPVDNSEYVKEYKSPKGRKTIEHTRKIYVKVAGHPQFIFCIEHIQSIITHKKDILNFAKHPRTKSPLVIHYKGRHILVLPYGTVIPHYIATAIAKNISVFVNNWANVPDAIKKKLAYGTDTRMRKRSKI